MRASSRAAARASLLFAGLSFTASGCVVSDSGGLSLAGWREVARREETHALDLAPGERLRVVAAHGEVALAAEEGESRVLASLRARADTQEHAREALEGTRVVVAREEGGIVVRIEGPPATVLSGNVQAVFHPRVDLDVRVPPGTRVDVESASGDLAIRGRPAATRLASAHGDVRVEGVEGDLEVECGSGDVAIAAATGASIAVRATHGDVELVRSRGVRLAVSSQSGDVEVRDVEAPEAAVESTHGDVLVAGLRGSLEAKSQSGDVDVRDHAGRCRAQSTHGDVDVEGALDALDARSQSGRVRAVAAAGSRIGAGWELASTHGDVVLEVAGELGFEVDARSGHGRVSVGLPHEAVERDGKRVLRASVRGGGPKVRLVSASGDVVVR